MKETASSLQTDCPSAGPTTFGPAPFCADPKEIASSPALSIAEKREILSSWASDARAVADAPGLRKIDNGAIVGIHEILETLKILDATDSETRGQRPKESARFRGRDPSRGWILGVSKSRRKDDDDDDPPPCPAVIAPIPRLPPFGAEVALEAA